MDASETASELGGLNLFALQAVGVKSLVNDVADVLIKTGISSGNESDTETDHVVFRNEAGVWKQFGNQRIASVNVEVESRTQQGGTFSTATDVFAGTEPNQGLVTAATVTGPTNNPSAAIWGGASSAAIPKRSPELKSDGLVHDEFALISQPLGGTFDAVNAIVPVGSTFTIALTTNGQGSPQYKVESNAISVDPIQFTPLPAHVDLSAVVNTIRYFQFTLPTTFAYSTLQVHLNANIGSSVSTGPTCDVQGQILNVDRVAGLAQGSITFPADMTPCGLNGVAIARITVFAEVDGTLGETSLATLFLPY